MRKFLIERSVPGVATMSDDELQGISAKSVSVLRDLGPDVQWVVALPRKDSLAGATVGLLDRPPGQALLRLPRHRSRADPRARPDRRVPLRHDLGGLDDDQPGHGGNLTVS